MLNFINKVKNNIIIERFIYPGAMELVKRNLVTKDDLKNRSEEDNSLYKFYNFGFEESINYENNLKVQELTGRVVNNPLSWAGKNTERENLYTATLPAPFVSEVKNVELVGPFAMGITRDGEALFEIEGSLMERLQGSIKATLKTFGTHYIRKPPIIDSAFSLVIIAQKNYFHWLTDCLLRIEGFEYYCEVTGEKPSIIISSNPSTWMVESLKLVGYDVNDCVSWNGYRAKVNRLLIPSFRRHWPSPFISPAACHWLRKRILSNIPDAENYLHSCNSHMSPHVFISRKKASKRRIVNEDELSEVFSPMGFIFYNLEDMNFADQVRLFSQAKVIVAPHGAGLTNMLFSKEATIIELFGSNINFVYFALARGLGFQYDFLTCQPQCNDMIVSCDALRKLISKFI